MSSFIVKSESLIADYKKENKLLLFTVPRGINYEAINFPDDVARMVICICLPYTKLIDIKVKIKSDYLNEKI